MWASIVSFIEAWKVTARLAERFVEAYISHRVRKIESDHLEKIKARNAIITEISRARSERNTEQLIALNHALAIVEHNKL